MTVEEQIRLRLTGLEPMQLRLIDDSAAHAGHVGARQGGHYRLVIVSEKFRSLTRLARHRAVMDCVADLIPTPIHALSVRALAPDETE